MHHSTIDEVLPLPHGEYTSTISDSPARLNNAAWLTLCPEEDWGMNLRLLALQQEELADQAHCWFMTIRDLEGRPVLAAALAMFHVDIVRRESRLSRMVTHLRRFWPAIMKMPVLFCGLPVPCGSNHLRIAPDADVVPLLQHFDAAMLDLARREGARLVVVKELDQSQSVLSENMQALGYISGDIPPNYCLQSSFASFEDYLGALNSRARKPMKKAQAAFARANLTSRTYTDADEIARVYDDRLHSMYLHLRSHAGQTLECFPATFFRKLPFARTGTVALTVIELAGEPVAFGYCVLQGHEFHMLYSGYDNKLNEDYSLYFNVTQKCMEWAFSHGATQLVFGQTSGRAKMRYGALPQSLTCLVRATNPLMHRVLKLLAGQLFPEIAAEPVRHVFAERDE